MKHCTILGRTCTALECDGGRLCPNIVHWREQLEEAEHERDRALAVIYSHYEPRSVTLARLELAAEIAGVSLEDALRLTPLLDTGTRGERTDA